MQSFLAAFKEAGIFASVRSFLLRLFYSFLNILPIAAFTKIQLLSRFQAESCLTGEQTETLDT